jgi:hypothetical protein
MSHPVYVDAYSGYKANERPRQFQLDEEIYEIANVLDQWFHREDPSGAEGELAHSRHLAALAHAASIPRTRVERRPRRSSLFASCFPNVTREVVVPTTSQEHVAEAH